MFYVIWVQTLKEHEFKSRFEKDIDSTLYNRILLISRTEKQKHKDGHKEISRLIFPGYLFVETDHPDKIHEHICSQPSYIKILGNDGHFLPLTKSEEDFLNRITGHTDRVDMSLGIIENGIVKILKGPLFGFEQYIVKVDRHKRKAYLEMKLFGETKRIIAGLIWARAAVLTCDRFNKPKKVLLIYDNEQAKENGLSIINKLTRKFVLHGVKHVNEDVSKTILHITTTRPEALMLCGLHSTPRNAILKFCATNSIPVYIRPNIGDYLLDDAREIQMANLPVKVYEKSDKDYFYLFLKRLFDIVLSLTGLIVASPIMLIIAIAIKLYDGGPIFYTQVRLTKDRKEFTIYKFRSMKIDAEADGRARLASVADDRITPVGKLIRATRIDELPQIICILKGDMSIVGPRPERPELCRVYEEEMPEFALRTEVKVGLPGYAQVYGKYNTEPYDKLQMDLMYISNQNLYTDFKIILATIKIMFLPESTEGVKN